MKPESGRWLRRVGSDRSVSPHAPIGEIAPHASGPAASTARPSHDGALAAKLSRSAFAFRGYDVANLGRSRELLHHPRYASTVLRTLDEVGAVASETLGRRVDLVGRIDRGETSTIASFPDDVAMIVGMELAQLKLLEDEFGCRPGRARLALGYSIGELAAMIAGGVYPMESLLPVALALAPDCAELAENTTMGVLFTREPELAEAEVVRLCRSISAEGTGLIGPSAFLSPNTCLLLGEGETLDRFDRAIPRTFPGRVILRRNANRWPPLHSPIVWRRNIPNRVATAMYAIKGGNRLPSPPIVSCVTGSASYDGENSRDLIIRWTDAPQRLWDAIDATVSAGVETVIHVGPAPNLIPATFDRLSNNINRHLHNKYLQKLSHDFVTTMNRHAWLAHALPSKASLLRIPFIEQIILEDWLLARPIV